MKRILILANFDVGLYKFRKELIQELLNRGNEVYISLPDGELVRNLEKMGCKFVNTAVDRRGINPKTDAKLMFFYHKLIKKLHPDMVITYTIKPNIYGGLMCRLLHVPYAVNITGLGTAFQSESKVKKLVTFLYKIALKKAKVVFFENTGNKQTFLDFKILKENQTCVLNGAGVNLDEYCPIDYQNGDITKFIFIGRVMKEKGIDELFYATKKLISEGVSCSLDIVGGYEEDYGKIINKYVDEGWLHYYGYQKNVQPYISRAHCSILPSWHEGMANTNLECAASALPIITTNIHGCKEAVVNEVSGYTCEKNNEESLYKRMKQFCGLTYEKRKLMGLEGRRHMQKYFDKKDVINKTVEKLME